MTRSWPAIAVAGYLMAWGLAAPGLGADSRMLRLVTRPTESNEDRPTVALAPEPAAGAEPRLPETEPPWVAQPADERGRSPTRELLPPPDMSAPDMSADGSPAVSRGHDSLAPREPALDVQVVDHPRFWERLVMRADELGAFGPPATGRHRGLGSPLERESWLTRPFSISYLNGLYSAADPVRNELKGSSSYIGSLRLGWDFSHYWGMETGFSMATVGLGSYPGAAPRSDLHVAQFDTQLHYYPWGDSRWRPYGTLGVGLANYQFSYVRPPDVNNLNQTAFALPWGGGLKYRYSSALAFRLELLDNVSFASGGALSTMNNFTFLIGLEAHLGLARRRSYWPWNPSGVWF